MFMCKLYVTAQIAIILPKRRQKKNESTIKTLLTYEYFVSDDVIVVVAVAPEYSFNGGFSKVLLLLSICLKFF